MKLWREKNIIVQDCSLKHGALSKKVLEMSRAVHFVKLKVWFGYQLVHCRLTMALFQLLTAVITNSFHAVKIFSYFRKMLFQRRKAIFSTMIVVWMAEATDLIDVFIILILTLITNISDIIIINKHCLSLTLARLMILFQRVASFKNAARHCSSLGEDRQHGKHVPGAGGNDDFDDDDVMT